MATLLGDTSIVQGKFAGTDSVLVSSTTSWTATSNVPWLTTSASGTGNGVASFSFLGNDLPVSRTGTLTIGGQTLTITQAGTVYNQASPVTTLLTSGFGTPVGVSVDDAGIVYGASQGSIVRYNPATGQRSTVVSGAGASDVAVDSGGVLGYFVDSFARTLSRFNPSNGSVTTLVTSGLSNPAGVAVDRFENVYIADSGANVIRRFAGGLTTVVSSGLNSPQGVAVDFNGIVYIADTGNNAVKRWNPATNQLTTVVTGLNGPTKVAADRSGNVYIADANSSAIRRWNSATNQLTTLVSSGLNRAQGVGVDLDGNVYIGDTFNNALKVIPRAFVASRSTDFTAAAGTGTLLPVLPTTQPLGGALAPTVDQPWVTIGGIQNGAASFSFTENPSATQRFATINVLGVPSFVVQAPPILVGTLADNLSSSPRSLRQAIEFVNARAPIADVIVIPASLYTVPTSGQPDPNTIRLGSELPAIVPGVDLKIRAEVPAGTVRAFSVSGENLSRIVQTGPTATLRLENLTLSNGNVGNAGDGGAVINSGTLTLLNSAITNSRAVKGGAIASSGPVTLIDSVISGNIAGQVGAGIFTLNAPVTITRGTLSDNRTDASAGVSGRQTNGGGGIWGVGSVITVVDSTFSGNRNGPGNVGSSTNGGAGIAVIQGSTLNVTGTAFSDNISVWNGGGLFIAESTATIVQSTFSANIAGFGGGVSNVGSDVTLRSSTFTLNRASSSSVFSPRGSAVIMAFGNNATLLIDGSTFDRNANGTIEVFGLSGSAPNALTLLNSTVTTSAFGGLFVGTDAIAAITHSTIFGNGTVGSGSDLQTVSPVTLRNSIVGTISGGAGLVQTMGVNIVQSGLTGQGVINADPRLGPLSDNGGPTGTLELQPGSPAINATSTVPGITADQRGVPRDATPDVGAFEYVPLVVTTATDEDDGTINPASGTGTSLREAIQHAQSNPFTRTITFAPALAGQTLTLTRGWTGTIDDTALRVTGDLTIDAQDRQITLAMASGVRRRVFLNSGGTFNLRNITLTGGDVSGTFFSLGGAMFAAGPLNLTNVQLVGNRAGLGGAIFVGSNVAVSIASSTFTTNTGVNTGGAIYVETGGTASVGGSTFTNNSAGEGGAILAFGTLIISNSTFSNNASGGDGGALWLFGTTTITGSTFNGNTVGNEGGALISFGSLTVINSTFADNGHNALVLFDGTADLQHLTVAYNRNGGVAITGAATTLRNTIVAGNSGFDLTGPLTATSSNNLLNRSAADVRIGPLADNGGPTLTILPLPGSPAVNNGINLFVSDDQRGQLRFFSAVDIGAVELQPTGASLTDVTFEFETRQAIVFDFDRDATADFLRSSYFLENRTANQNVPRSAGTLTWNTTGTQAVLDLPDLPDANYRLSTRLRVQTFHILRGDANRDRTVDFADLLILAQNYGQSGKTFSQGNFDYSPDGLVGFSDLLILAQNYNASVISSTSTVHRRRRGLDMLELVAE